MKEASRKPSLKLTAVIVDRGDERLVTDIISEERAHVHFITLAEGTAGTDLMALLGLESREKTFVLCFAAASRVKSFTDKLTRKLKLHQPGKGIAFTMPITGINRQALDVLQREETEEDRKMEDDAARSDARKFCMILCMVTKGHVDELMEAAKSAGARGGTVLSGRRIELGDDTTFLGIAAQQDKEIVTILTAREQKNAIMSAIADVCGMHTEARGVIASLPVEEIIGLGGMTAR